MDSKVRKGGMGEPRLTSEEIRASQMWKMGAGSSARRFNGENPIPEKTEVAIKNSRKTESMPEQNVLIPMNVTIPHGAMQVALLTEKYGGGAGNTGTGHFNNG